MEKSVRFWWVLTPTTSSHNTVIRRFIIDEDLNMFSKDSEPAQTVKKVDIPAGYRPFYFKVYVEGEPEYVTLWGESYLVVKDALTEQLDTDVFELGTCITPPLDFPGTQEDLLVTIECVEAGHFIIGAPVFWDTDDKALRGPYIVRGCKEGTVTLEGQGPHGTESHIADINDVFLVDTINH